MVEIKKGDKTIGILPLYCSTKTFLNVNFRILRPIGFVISDYLIPILSKDYSPEKQLRKAFDKIYEDKANWDYIEWTDIPEHSTFDSIFKSHVIKEYSHIERNQCDVCPYLVLKNKTIEEIKLNMDEELLKKILSKERKLKKRGNLTYTKVLTEQEIEPVMNVFFDLHCERWGKT